MKTNDGIPENCFRIHWIIKKASIKSRSVKCVRSMNQKLIWSRQSLPEKGAIFDVSFMRGFYAFLPSLEERVEKEMKPKSI